VKLETLAFLKDGKYRIAVLKELSESPKLPSEIAYKLNISRVSISRILKTLKEKGMVESHSKDSRAIVYSITNEGIITLKECLK
jgi:DNA-binding MarR family transcriptional regulator